jgi:methyl-accepting chemotaxis protein
VNLDSALETVIRELKAGQYSARIRIDDPDPAARHTADRINLMLETVDAIVSEKNKEISGHDRRSAYFSRNLESIAKNLAILAGGDFRSPFMEPDDDPLIHDAYLKVSAITRSAEEVRISVSALSRDIATALQETMNDRDHQVEKSHYKGDYLKIMTGISDALRSIKEPLRESFRVVERFAAYDFGARFSPSVKVEGEWIPLKESLNLIGAQISEAFSNINRQIMELSANAQEANASVQEVATSSEQVAHSSDAVSQNTEQSDAGVRQVLRAMEDLSVTVGEVSQKADSVSRIAQESTALSREGTEFARKAEEGMGVITRSAGDVDTIIGEIQQEMKKINEIVRLITDIANQTNLLALNAAIEAARAGEMGRGFAVVAAEVKTLALESRKSAEKITDMITGLQKKSQTAADAVSTTSAAVQDGNVMLSDTLRIFGRLVTSVEEISSNIEQVASMNEEQAAAVEEITSSMHEVSAMLKDTAKEAMDSAHATGETSTSVNQLKVIVDQVAGIAEQISISMAKFKL